MEFQNLFWISVYLSNIELYFTSASENKDEIELFDEEFHHCVKVMRNAAGDEIYITNGSGKIFQSIIEKISKNSLAAVVINKYDYQNDLENVSFCIPKLKNNDRFEFALEKCTELGITNFIIFDSERAMHKSDKKERWQKIVLSAMKQSLRSYLPVIRVVHSLNEITKLDGEKIVLEQNSKQDIRNLKTDKSKKYYFVFGPEGGFTEDEMTQFDENNFYKLAYNRLRTETAIIKCASIVTL